MNGVIVINKEKEFTSFDCVAVIRKVLGVKKVGHTGTLDPNATGVLPILIGKATKAQDILPNGDKEYIANFMFGTSTDTLDIWGKVRETKDSNVKYQDLLNTLDSFVGEIKQIPPMYSAIKKDGKKLYELAREGIEVERKERDIKIYNIDLLDFDEDSQKGCIRVMCSSGTYIRTLIDDISKSLGTIGVMTDLLRTKASGFTLSQAITLEQLKALKNEDKIDSIIQSTESLFYTFKEIVVSDKQAVRFKNGNPLDLSRLKEKDLEDSSIYRVKDRENSFISLGIVSKENNELKMYKHF